MSNRWTRFAVICVLVAAWGMPAASQSTFVKVPIAIENVMLHTEGADPQPLSMPVSAPVPLVPPCGYLSFGTLSMNVANNGVDLAFAGRNFDCASEARLSFDVVLQVPVVSLDAVAFVSLVSEVGEHAFTNSPTVPGATGIASLTLGPVGASATSSSLFPLPLRVDFSSLVYEFGEDPPTVGTSGSTSITPLIPGDEVRIPMSVRVRLDGPTGGGNLEGAFDVRFEFQTRLPLPVSGLSPSLSIPFGVMGLTGLARLRG